MKHLRKPTLPVAPWDIPDPSGEKWDAAPDEAIISIVRAKVTPPSRKSSPKKPVDEAVMHNLMPAQSTPVRALVGRTFMGQLNVSDLDYMAKAILQLLDEMHELRERVRILEAGGNEH